MMFIEQMREAQWRQRIITGAILIGVAIASGVFWGGVAYAVYHFISKFW